MSEEKKVNEISDEELSQVAGGAHTVDEAYAALLSELDSAKNDMLINKAEYEAAQAEYSAALSNYSATIKESSTEIALAKSAAALAKAAKAGEEKDIADVLKKI